MFSTSLLLEFCDVGIELVEVLSLLAQLLLQSLESANLSISLDPIVPIYHDIL